MYLLDTNIFLEILLQREKSEAAKHLFMANASKDLFMIDFSLHSLGVFLFQRNRQDEMLSLANRPDHRSWCQRDPLLSASELYGFPGGSF